MSNNEEIFPMGAARFFTRVSSDFNERVRAQGTDALGPYKHRDSGNAGAVMDSVQDLDECVKALLKMCHSHELAGNVVEMIIQSMHKSNDETTKSNPSKGDTR